VVSLKAVSMSPESVQLLFALTIGFAVAGLCASAYRLITSRLPGLDLLSAGPRPSAFAALVLLIVAAPFLIMRSTFAGGGEAFDRFQVAFLATVIAGFWSMMSGMALMMALEAVLPV
jgi:hypothetical protein